MKYIDGSDVVWFLICIIVAAVVFGWCNTYDACWQEERDRYISDCAGAYQAGGLQMPASMVFESCAEAFDKGWRTSYPLAIPGGAIDENSN